MKIKNKMNDVRILRSFGQIIEFQPGEIKDVEKPIYEASVFEVVNTQKSNEKKEQLKTKKEVE